MPYKNAEDKRAWKNRNRAFTCLHSQRYREKKKRSRPVRSAQRTEQITLLSREEWLGLLAKLDRIKSERPPEIRGILEKNFTLDQRRLYARWTSRNRKPRLYRLTPQQKERKKRLDVLSEAERKKNPEIVERRRIRNRIYNKSTIQRRLRLRLQNRIRLALKAKNGSKRSRTQELTGCSWGEFKTHIERQMHPFMTWDNYGPAWHIDHIVPCCAFDLQDEAEQRRCFHYSNLRPLWAKVNLRRTRKGQAVQVRLPFRNG